jgi:hypothetical protein
MGVSQAWEIGRVKVRVDSGMAKVEVSSVATHNGAWGQVQMVFAIVPVPTSDVVADDSFAVVDLGRVNLAELEATGGKTCSSCTVELCVWAAGAACGSVKTPDINLNAFGRTCWRFAPKFEPLSWHRMNRHFAAVFSNDRYAEVKLFAVDEVHELQLEMVSFSGDQLHRHNTSMGSRNGTSSTWGRDRGGALL